MKTILKIMFISLCLGGSAKTLFAEMIVTWEVTAVGATEQEVQQKLNQEKVAATPAANFDCIYERNIAYGGGHPAGWLTQEIRPDTGGFFGFALFYCGILENPNDPIVQQFGLDQSPFTNPYRED